VTLFDDKKPNSKLELLKTVAMSVDEKINLGLKDKFEEKIKQVFDNSSTEELAIWVSHTFDNFHAVQEKLVGLRVRLMVLFCLFVAIRFQIFTITDIPGFGDADYKGFLEIRDLNSLVLLAIPIYFGYTYYLMLLKLIYRNQQRLVVERYYDKVFTSNDNRPSAILLMGYPQITPGHINKVLNNIENLDSASSERGSLRSIFQKCEKFIQPLMLLCMVILLFTQEDSGSRIFSNCAVVAVVLVLFSYVVVLVKRYSGKLI